MVNIRLRRQGPKSQHSFRIVVFNLRKECIGRYLEKIGHHKPRTQPITDVIKEDRALYWLSVGAQPEDAVRGILERTGTWERFQRLLAGELMDDLVKEAERNRKKLPSPKTVSQRQLMRKVRPRKEQEPDRFTDEAPSDQQGELQQQPTDLADSDRQPTAGPSESEVQPQVTNEFTDRDDDSNPHTSDEIDADRQPTADSRMSEARPPATHESDDKVGANEETDESTVDSIDVTTSLELDGLKLYSNLNRPGKTKLNDRFIAPLPLPNPDFRRRRKQAALEESMASEPELVERTRQVLTRKWDGKNPDTREFLKQQYGGRCQTCNWTFPKHDGEPYFEGLYIESYKKAQWLDDPANVLCLCAHHCAQFLHGTRVFNPDFRTQVLSYEDGAFHTLKVKLIGKDQEIRFTQSHIIDLKTIVEATETA